jgi:transposase InsO family protein
MGQVLHGSATTTEAVRRAIQRSQESVRALARRHSISPTTIQKWRRRQTTADAAMGPKQPHSPVLTLEQEAVIVAFRRHTLLPLDDCLYALQPTIPALTRSSLHRCLQRHGISRLPEVEGDKPEKQRFKAYPIGYFHIDIAEVRTEEGKLRLFVAIDRTSKFAFVRLVESAGKMEAAQFLRELVEAVPYKIHTVLTDNAIQFTTRERDIYDGWHIFDRVCDEHGIEHRLTKVNHPWTNQRAGRADEPHAQGRDRQAPPLRHPRRAARPPPTLLGGLQPCAPPQSAAWPHPLRVHLPGLDQRTGTVQAQSVTPHSGTEHLGRAQCNRGSFSGGEVALGVLA